MKYSRILLKLSGESLAGNEGCGPDENILGAYASQIVEVVRENCEVAVVTGGGNIFRGLPGTESGYDRVKGDQMGMLATVINSLALESAIRLAGGKAVVFTSIRMEPFKCISCGSCVRACQEAALELVEKDINDIKMVVYHKQGA